MSTHCSGSSISLLASANVKVGSGNVCMEVSSFLEISVFSFLSLQPKRKIPKKKISQYFFIKLLNLDKDKATNPRTKNYSWIRGK